MAAADGSRAHCTRRVVVRFADETVRTLPCLCRARARDREARGRRYDLISAWASPAIKPVEVSVQRLLLLLPLLLEWSKYRRREQLGNERHSRTSHIPRVRGSRDHHAKGSMEEVAPGRGGKASGAGDQ
jgi:hypothetical protein